MPVFIVQLVKCFITIFRDTCGLSVVLINYKIFTYQKQKWGTLVFDWSFCLDEWKNVCEFA